MIKKWVDVTKLHLEFTCLDTKSHSYIHLTSCCACVCLIASLFQWNLPGQEWNASSTTADWQRGQTFYSSAVCPLTSPKSVLISILTCQSAALCTASPLLCLSPGTTALTRHCGLVGFRSLKCSIFIPYFRLAQLLGHDFVLKPQYDLVACDTADVWLSCTHLTAALMDPLLIEASCPLTISGMSCFIIADFSFFLRACTCLAM